MREGWKLSPVFRILIESAVRTYICPVADESMRTVRRTLEAAPSLAPLDATTRRVLVQVGNRTGRTHFDLHSIIPGVRGGWTDIEWTTLHSMTPGEFAAEILLADVEVEPVAADGVVALDGVAALEPCAGGARPCPCPGVFATEGPVRTDALETPMSTIDLPIAEFGSPCPPNAAAPADDVLDAAAVAVIAPSIAPVEPMVAHTKALTAAMLVPEPMSMSALPRIADLIRPAAPMIVTHRNNRWSILGSLAIVALAYFGFVKVVELTTGITREPAAIAGNLRDGGLRIPAANPTGSPSMIELNRSDRSDGHPRR